MVLISLVRSLCLTFFAHNENHSYLARILSIVLMHFCEIYQFFILVFTLCYRQHYCQLLNYLLLCKMTMFYSKRFDSQLILLFHVWILQILFIYIYIYNSSTAFLSYLNNNQLYFNCTQSNLCKCKQKILHFR